MGFTAEIDRETATGAKLPENSSSGFRPLTPGKYQARIVKVEEQSLFGGDGDNANKPVVKIQVKIVEDSPTGANRVYFPRVHLFTKWASGKASNFAGFWRDAIGVPEAELLAGRLPGAEALIGKQITITLGKPKEPDDYNPLGSNEVSFFDAAGDVYAAPTGFPRVPWLTEDGKLIAGATTAPGQAPATQGAPPAYAPPAAPSAQAPAYAPPPAPGQIATATTHVADPWAAQAPVYKDETPY